MLCPARDINHRGGHSFSGAFAAPNDELERGVEAFAFRQRDFDEVFQRFNARHATAVGEYRVAEQRHALLSVEIEMAEPHAVVQHREKIVNVVALGVGDFHIELTGELQRADFFLPDEEHAVVAPASGEFDDQLVIVGAIEQPFVRGYDLLEDVEGIGWDMLVEGGLK